MCWASRMRIIFCTIWVWDSTSLESAAPASRPRRRACEAGPADSSDVESHTQIVQDMMRILEAQHIVPLDDLFDLANHLDSLARGEKLNTALVNRLASRIADIPLSRATLSAVEKNALSFGYWTDKHVDLQRKLNLRAAVEKASGEKLRDVRGLLAPFLRDTLVAYNYAHYAPPGGTHCYRRPRPGCL